MMMRLQAQIRMQNHSSFSSSIIVWDVETVPDIIGFARANGLEGITEKEVREAIGDKFPKHVYHSNWFRPIGRRRAASNR